MRNWFKKVSQLTAFFLLAALYVSASSTASAQFVAGGGLAIGTEDVIGGLGIQGNGYYPISEDLPIRVGGDVTIYFPGDNVNFWAVNLNGHYMFYQEDELSAYGVAGLNIATASFDFPDVGGFIEVDNSATEVGLNLGGGVEYGVDFGFLFGEIKFTVSDFDQLVLAGGVRFPLGQ